MSGERLVVLIHGTNFPELWTEGGRRVGTLRHGQREDAERLVACWNACEGLTRECVEGGLMVGSDTGPTHITAAYQSLRGRYSALRACLEASEVANEALKRDLAAAYVELERINAARRVAWYKPWTWRAWR